MSSTTYYRTSQTTAPGSATSLTDAVVDTMVRWPMRVTGATMDFMMEGMQRLTGGSGSSASNGYVRASSGSDSAATSTSGHSSGPRWTSFFKGSNSMFADQDLGGDDLKYVLWSIVFTKPGHECILQKQQEELVNYSADASSYAAVKIARFLDGARHGHIEKPEHWNEGGREESSRQQQPASSGNEKGWRISSEDQKYICFLFSIDRRLPRQEESQRVERVTVEKSTRVA